MSFSLRSRDLHIQFGSDSFFQYSWVPRRSWCKPFPHLKARGRDNEDPKLCHDDVIFDDHEIDDYMAYTACKMIILEQFRHALTRHDPKTYLK